ncbi:MAG TPA: glutamate synthase large subunit [Spirochaetota bacterium]|nr:glutamate synthase large subunit [Spirochaetota bacterium]
MMSYRPGKEGLYDPRYEHDSCGIGFVANIKGKKSYDIIKRGLEVLERMTHRGAEGADNKTGDGAGILMQIPHAFYAEEFPSLPQSGDYGTGLVFLPAEKNPAEECVKILELTAEEEGLEVIGWREIKVDSSVVGDIARKAEPAMKQIFIKTNSGINNNLELKLYVVRKLAEKRVAELSDKKYSAFYIPSLSSRTIVYKGMLMPGQVKSYFKDLQDDRVESAMALVHSRFSTNTFPSWDLAQPFRMLAHNGEINTIKGNRFWMEAREADLYSEILGDDIKKIIPVIEPGKSDSASFDNVLELLVAAGRPMPHAIMMMIPESWNDKNPIPDYLKFFYEYHSTFMEPWDGPASMVFCDGRYIGGTLDRNGLRPSRYVVTKDNMIVMGSEVGVQNFRPEDVAYKGRLMPGKLLLVDTVEGRIIPDAEVKQKIAMNKPYKEWVENNRINLDDIPEPDNITVNIGADILHQQRVAYGYNREDIEDIIIPMAATAQEPVGSMGTDTPLAVFSDKPQPLFNYFKQVFAQVTNPAIDPIREELVMSLTSYMGSRKNLLGEGPEHCSMLKYLRPVFTNGELSKIIESSNPQIQTVTIDTVFPADRSKGLLEKRLDEICREAEKAIDDGRNIIILSDRKAGSGSAAIPSLLVCSAVHHHLIRCKKRTRAGLIIESGEPREVMHYALLIGYGADAVNPYLAFATIFELEKNGKLKAGGGYGELEYNYIKSISKGLLKIFSKMGTSTIRSYRGAQVFEAVGLSERVVDKYFPGTPTRISGIDTDEIAVEAIIKNEKAFIEKVRLLEAEGVYSFRKSGEKHAWNPETIYMLQWATRTNDYIKYKEFTSIVDGHNRKPHFIRGLFDLNTSRPIPVDDVEPVSDIMKRLTTGAMSFGSISKEAHEAISIAMNSIQGRSNSGEGGEDPERFKRRPDGTSARSAIKQIASGRFGVTSNYLANADELQIKVAQGAKPGEGGQLPGYKVDGIIARTRHSTPGVTLISPPPHHDIYSIEDLAQLIFDLKNANPYARISVKLVSESGVGTIASGVAKAHADNILISGYDGGTGASPISSIKHAGLPWEIGLSETHQTLVKNDLRGRVRLQTDGQLKTGRDIVIAGMLGAEEFGFGTGVLIVLGCVMMRKCHMNTCPVGVATQDPDLRRRFKGKPEYIINYFRFMAQEIREIMASVGVSRFDDLIGRTDLLIPRKISHWKAGSVDPSAILCKPAEADIYPLRCIKDQKHKIDSVLDRKLIERVKPALDAGKEVNAYLEMPISNTDRSAGAMLSYEISKKHGESGLPDNSVQCTFHGSAGQSFGAFLAKGVTFRLEGDANDYFGKGLSGGRLIVVPPAGSEFKPEESIIVGNTVLYGATGGEAYVHGIAGERFCVRNSGALAVVEGTGDHCAEYMTGGRVIVLGKVGRNFAAGMSGGIAFVLDMDGDFDFFCNKGMVELSQVRDYDDQDFILEMLKKHIHYTDSALAKDIIMKWYDYLPKFVRVLPLEYKRAMNEMKISLIDEKLKAIREEEQIMESY